MTSKNRKLLIITGAGASYDLVDTNKTTVPVNRAYRPPLTINIFKAPTGPTVERGESSCIQDIVAKHSLAAVVGTKYYIDHSGQNVKPLEKYLFDLKESRFLTDRQRSWAIPYYLEELFLEISLKYFQEYVDISTNYTFLLDRLRGNWEDIVWLNLNYDLFADRALAAHLKDPRKLNNLEDYMSLETKDGLRIKYTKPHGSVNWVRKIRNKVMQGSDIRAGNAPDNFEENLEDKIYHKYGGKIISGDEHYLFPAISTPTGKYSFVYQDHRKEIENVVREIDSLLCIGFSASDEDILQVMKNMPVIKRMLIVNGSYDNGRYALDNMKNSGVKIDGHFGGDDNAGIYHSGLSSFVANEKQEKRNGNWEPYSYMAA